MSGPSPVANVPLMEVFQHLLSSLVSPNQFLYFRNVNHVSVNLDTLAPGYFADSDLL